VVEQAGAGAEAAARLDLKGGVHLVLGVQVDKAVENATERVANELRDTLRRKRLGSARCGARG